MSYQSFTSPLPSPPADGHSLPFLPTKRLDLLRQAGDSCFTPPRRQNAWVMSGADSDGDSESSEEGRRSTEERAMSIPTIVLTPPQSPVSQFLLSEEDIQSSLNANQRRERLFGFGTRLTGLGEKMGMMNIASSFANSYTAPESPSPVARSRSVSPPPVSTPISEQYDEATAVPGIVCPSPIKINIVPPQAAIASPVAPSDFRLTQCPSPSARGNRRPSLVRADQSVVMELMNTMDSGIDMALVKQPASWTPTQIAQPSVDQSRPASTGHGSRRKSHPPTLPSPVTTPSAAALRSSFDDLTTNDSSTHFRAFPEPAITWTRIKVSPYRFKSYLFLLIPLVFVFLHIYYLSVDRQFMRAGHAMVFGKPITATTLWSSGDASLVDEHFDGFADTIEAEFGAEDNTSDAEWYNPDAKVSNDEHHASPDSHSIKNGHKQHRGGHGRWLKRAIA
ncbi:hypothetical protein QFC20_002346 [Naganishia adeliensis]|uniref:Uncharacterized protein n=1 Tax=Naganishia adeliensis TaxID=92952 RepID=A0ACC2WK89_9TREE|nr:hypothetical protein QFC20_002346 [Naganishia adeliensis]